MAAQGVVAGWLTGLGGRVRAAEAAAWATTATATVAGLFLIDFAWLGGWTALPSTLALPGWVAAGLGLLALAGAAAALLWRAAERGDGSRPGRLRLAAAVTAGIGAALPMAELSQAPRLAAVVEATGDLRDWRMAYDADSRTLRVRGAIGPGFARTLRAKLDRHAVDRLEIASAGGLVREALAAGRLVEQRGLVVVARERCASACVMVLMAGRERWAAWNMPVEFHAVSSATPTRSSPASERRERRLADVWLRRHGAPPDLLAESDRIGPDYMLPAASIDLVASGVLTGLVDEAGRPMPFAEAEQLLSIAPRPVRLDR